MVNWTDRELANLMNTNRDLGLDRTGQETIERVFPTPDPRAMSGGLAAQMSGSEWEEALNVYHAYLTGAGLALVHKTGPSVKFTKTRILVTGPGPCDYVGVLNNGLAVHFEAKSTSDLSGFTLPLDTLHQLAWLQQVEQWAPAFYLVWWRQYGDGRIHPVHSVDGRRIRRNQGYPVADGVRWYKTLMELLDGHRIP